VTDRLAAQSRAECIGFVDSPVGGLASRADRVESPFTVGATEADFQRVKPMLEAMDAPPLRGSQHVWVEFRDLPEATRDALWQKLENGGFPDELSRSVDAGLRAFRRSLEDGTLEGD
jgi:hypothetical protein